MSSPYGNIMAGLDYMLRRYAPGVYTSDGPLTGDQWGALTPEQQDAEVAERVRVRDAARAAKRDEAEIIHSKTCANADGFRRAVLELHAPTFDEYGSNPGCSCCYDSEYGADDWPCETYVLARDWNGDAA